MRLIFSIFTAIVVLLAGLIFVAPMFISTEEMRTQLFARVESMTGYRLRVSGPLDISLFPSIELVARDVGVAEPSAGGEEEFATAKTLRFGLMLSGLLQGNVRVREITLIDPVIAVPQAKTAPGGGEPGRGPADGKSGLAKFADQLKTVALDRLVIENGAVTLPPKGGEPGMRIESLDLEASLPGYDEPLSLDTNAVVDGKPIEIDGSVGSFGPFLEGSPVSVRITAVAPDALDAPVNVSGMASYVDDTFALTQFSAKSGDKTLSGTAVYEDDTATLSQFTATVDGSTFAGNAVYKDDVVTINPLRANVGGSVLAGQVEANLAGKVPYVVAALAAGTLDLDNIPQMKASGPKKSASTSSSRNADSGGGGGAPSPWSNTKIDFSPLKSVNGKFTVTAEKLIYNKIAIAPVTVQATLDGGKLNATLSKFNLYGGAGDAAVAVDASGKPAMRVQLSISSFDAYPLLRDAAGFENLEGRGTVALDLSAFGDSERAIVSTLGGNASIQFTDGAIRGVNIAQMIRRLGTGIVEGWQGGQAEKTDFASLGATFNVTQGKATTEDLALIGPLVRVNGSGTVDVAAKTLQLRVDPQLVASLEGQGGATDLAGLGVPVMITGPWSSPKLYPDIKGILENPAAAYERLKQFGDGVSDLPGLEGAGALSNVIKDGKVDKDALIQGIGGLLGGAGAASTGENADPNAPADAPLAGQPDANTTAQPDGALSNVIKDGKVDQDALIQGIGGLLGGAGAAPAADAPQAVQPEANPAVQPETPAEAVVAEPDEASEEEPTEAVQKKKKKKKKNKRAEKKREIEDAAKQLLDNFLSGQ